MEIVESKNTNEYSNMNMISDTVKTEIDNSTLNISENNSTLDLATKMSSLNDMSTVEHHENPPVWNSSGSDMQIQVDNKLIVKETDISTEIPIKMDTSIIHEQLITNKIPDNQETSSNYSFTMKTESNDSYPEIIKINKFQNGKTLKSIGKSTSLIMSNIKKRKAPTFTVNMYQFVTTIWSVFNDTEHDNKNNKFIIPNNLLKYMNNNNDTSDKKKLKLDSTINDWSNKSELKNKDALMLMIVIQVMSALEKSGAVFQFSKEALKYFLATYSRFIVPLDFMDTNTIIRSEKKNKNCAPLPLGGLLLEYTKGLDVFISNMSRGDKCDISAFRFIMENKIELSPNIYHLCNVLTFTDVKYEINIHDTYRDGYIKIPTFNPRRATVLITNCIFMVYDGNQFVIPPISMEKDIQMNMIIKSSLAKDEYILLDILLSARNKALDIIDANIKDYIKSENYHDRLEFLRNKFTDLKLVSIKREPEDTSYVQKKLIGSGVSYIYHKPNSTAAVIGTFEKHAYVAFKQDDFTLIVKAKCNIAGPMVFNIATASYQKEKTNVIMCNEKKYKIVGDLSNINLLRVAIPVEIKDTNKIGNRSNHDISNVMDYKPPSLSKDTSVMDNLKQALVNPDNANKLIDIIRKSSNYDAIIQGLLKNKEASDVQIDFGDY